MFYREKSNSRFLSKTLSYRYTNISVGVATLTCNEADLWKELLEEILATYELLEDFIAAESDFEKSYKPLNLTTNSETIRRMLEFSAQAAVGPMATVAGMYSERIVELAGQYCSECYCENGGDIALIAQEDVELSLFPGWEMDGAGLGIRLPAGQWGVASSSGKFGRSNSLGQADLVTVIDSSAIRADAFATAIANDIKTDSLTEDVLDNHKDLAAVAIFYDGKFHYRGDFELNFG